MPGLSPKLPVAKDPVDGFALTKTYTEMIQQNFKHLVLTSPGERIMDPDFGVGIRSFLFQQMTPITFSDIRERIQQQVAMYLPFVQIQNIFFDSADDEQYSNLLAISIEYFITATGVHDVLKVVIDNV